MLMCHIRPHRDIHSDEAMRRVFAAVQRVKVLRAFT